MTRYVPDRAARAITLLVSVQDEIELAGRSPGDLVTHRRQDDEQNIANLREAARLIREMAERGHE
jgi:hypothetical protein